MNDGSGLSLQACGAAEEQIVGLQQRSMLLSCVRRAKCRERLSVQHGDIHQNGTGEHSCVGRHAVALADGDHIPRNELARAYLALLVVSDHACLCRWIGGERLDRTLRVMFLSQREGRVDEDHRHDRDG